ncbi:zinc-finger of the MIZ type in Nse subunit domain-containing protein [Trichoderma austrokoningii]
MPRRLFSGDGRTAAASTTTIVALPSYEPLSCPLSDTARRQLIELSNSRGAAPYEAQLKESIRHIGLSVSDLHERLRRNKDRLAIISERRERKGTDKTAEEERLEQQVPEFEKDAERLTRESERALRETIDRKAELEDEASVLEELSTTATTNSIAQTRSAAATQSRRRRANRVGSDDEEQEEGGAAPVDQMDEDAQEPVISAVDAFRDLRAKKRAEYAGLSVHQRYGLNNDYIGFKKLWHEAAAGEDGPPLPDASRWFDSNGEPDMTIPGGDAQNGSLDDDEEVAVSRENISINCPLTLRPMNEPYRSRKCPHVFEKAAILDYLPLRGELQCPQTGCSQNFSRARFEHEFFLDEAMKMRIQRSRQAEQNRQDMDDEDEDDADESLLVSSQRQARGGRGRGRGVKRETKRESP